MERFSFEKWYQGSLKKNSFKAVFIPLTKEVLDFLTQESIIVSEEEIEKIDNNTKSFISKYLEEYESLFMKLNFSAATDAYFFLEDLRITSLEELLILLKGSTKFIEDLKKIGFNIKKEAECDNNSDSTVQAIKDSVVVSSTSNCNLSPILTLKKWYSLDPSKEFRCYFYKSELILICQRYNKYTYNYEEDFLKEMYSKIKAFLQTLYAELKQFEVAELYSIDIYVDIEPNYKLRILDVNYEVDRNLLYFNSIEEVLKMRPDHIIINRDNDSIHNISLNRNGIPQELIEYGGLDNIIKMFGVDSKQEKENGEVKEPEKK